MKNDLIAQKSKTFAIRIVRLYKHLKKQNEFVLSNQILRSGTSIVANAYEAKYAQSRADLISKRSISLKEASETELWLDLLLEMEVITEEQHASLHNDVIELIKMYTAIINRLKSEEEVDR